MTDFQWNNFVKITDVLIKASKQPAVLNAQNKPQQKPLTHSEKIEKIIILIERINKELYLSHEQYKKLHKKILKIEEQLNIPKKKLLAKRN